MTAGYSVISTRNTPEKDRVIFYTICVTCNNILPAPVTMCAHCPMVLGYSDGDIDAAANGPGPIMVELVFGPMVYRCGLFFGMEESAMG